MTHFSFTHFNLLSMRYGYGSFFFFQHRCSTLQIPHYWKKCENEKLFNRDDNYKLLYRILEQEINLRSAARNQWSVIYASGMSKIGKTAFGMNAPSKLLEISKQRNDQKVMKLLEEPIYLKLDADSGGDDYSELDDISLKEEYCLGWRLLARACGFDKGVAQLRNALQTRKVETHIINKDLNKCKELTKILVSITSLQQEVIPEDVILALANDYRDIKGLQNDDKVMIIVHHDEHQMIYEQRAHIKKFTKRGATKAHKKYLYPLCTMRADGTNLWCKEHDIVLLPIFTGTSGSVLHQMMKPTQYDKQHILLDILNHRDSQALFEKYCNQRVDESWKKKKFHDSDHMNYVSSPFDVILSELGGIPGIIQKLAPKLSLFISEPIGNRDESILKTIQFLRENVSLTFGIVNPLLLQALICLCLTGISVKRNLKIHGICRLSQTEIHGLFLFRQMKDGTCKIHIPPCYLPSMISESNDIATELVPYYTQILNLEIQKPGNYSTLFEKLNANRIYLILYTLRNIAQQKSCNLNVLFPSNMCNDIASYVDIDLTKLSQLDSRRNFVERLSEEDALIDDKLKSCLHKDHIIVHNDQYHIYMLPPYHPLFDIFVKLPSERTKYNEIHIFVQCKSSCNLFYESRTANIHWEKHIAALCDHKENYEKLTNRKIQCCFVYIDSRRKHDDEWIKNCLETKDYPIITITHQQFSELFPNLSHLFVF